MNPASWLQTMSCLLCYSCPPVAPQCTGCRREEPKRCSRRRRSLPFKYESSGSRLLQARPDPAYMSEADVRGWRARSLLQDGWLKTLLCWGCFRPFLLYIQPSP